VEAALARTGYEVVFKDRRNLWVGIAARFR
jgi:hypothetical protein